MKVLHGVVAGAALLAATAAWADDAAPSGAPNGWYAGIAGGLNAPEPRPIVIDQVNNARVKFKDGMALGIDGGYKWAQGFRTELEFNYGDGKARDLTDHTFPLIGKQHDYAVMGNILWDFANVGRWSPYIGIGLGLGWINWDHIGRAGSATAFNGSSTKFAWQGIAGLAYSATQNLQITLDYRYKGSGAHRYVSNAGDTVTGYDARSNRVMLGLRYAFGAPEAPAAAPPPPPAPMAQPAPPPAPPPPPPAEQKFIVFFDFDKSNLRTDAAKVVSEAADYAKKNGKVRVVTTGHTDTSGTAAYNMGLSERRAKTVEKELERLGIPKSEVVVRWKGESEPLVQTGDGVKEPQNRRVEIVLE